MPPVWASVVMDTICAAAGFGCQCQGSRSGWGSATAGDLGVSSRALAHAAMLTLVHGRCLVHRRRSAEDDKARFKQSAMHSGMQQSWV